MTTHDVLVVGGGPGGSTVAWRLARAGRRVLVLDAATFPRVKLCAGWVTRRALADLELEPDAYPHTIQPFASVTIAHRRARFPRLWLVLHQGRFPERRRRRARRSRDPRAARPPPGPRLRGDGRLPADLALTPFRGHAYRVRRALPRRLAGERFVLVGDAAGLARDVSGEGIGPAVRSALLAAEAILDGRPASYAERVARTFGRPEGGLARLTRHIPESIIVTFARLACMRPGLRRRLVLEGAFGMG